MTRTKEIQSYVRTERGGTPTEGQPQAGKAVTVDASIGLEQSPHIRTLAIAIRNTLLSEEALVVAYPKPRSDRTFPRRGVERILTLDSENGDVQMNVRAGSVAHPDYKNTLTICWKNETKHESGLVQLTDHGDDRYSIRAEKNYSLPLYDEWRNTGGIEGVDIGIDPMSLSEIEELTEQLDKANPNLVMTQAAFDYLEKHHKAKKIEDTELPTINPRKELE